MTELLDNILGGQRIAGRGAPVDLRDPVRGDVLRRIDSGGLDLCAGFSFAREQGGPGRAGGGEELGGLRALNFYHRRTAVQAAAGVLDALPI